MWWFLVFPVVKLIIGVVDAVASEATPTAPTKPSTSDFNSGIEVETILTSNLCRLQTELRNSSLRKIAFIGQPGAGKSTALDNLTDECLQPRPGIGVSTDMTDWSVERDVTLYSSFKDFIFVDAPGYGTIRHPTDTYLRLFPFDLFDEIFVFLNGKLLDSDERLVQYARNQKRKITVVQTHAHRFSVLEQEIRHHDLRARLGVEDHQILYLENRTGSGIAELKSAVFGHGAANSV
ncbi:GTPase domain-containing protein [Deinococcus sp. QL22]|uniref:GTPase n=1 Tax=Deinococcus sp. QL22 TaxID=2939437 RepID=UPI002016B111|nr:GTPase domain-containing protein [Deinococcus sp. QL22]UQN08789.1 GTPase domain-containing protein [Deinococcus sp. QL22]